MRLSNVLIGFLLALALAYIHDASVSGVADDGRPQTIVNWDVLHRAAGGAYGWVADQLDTLAEQLRRSR